MNSRNIRSCEYKIKSIVVFENLKSSIILKKILEYLKKNKSFEIMKHNKRLQKRLNLSINDYKEYSNLYTPIEIELKLVDNKYSKFINMYEEDKNFIIYILIIQIKKLKEIIWIKMKKLIL